ncbi:phosphate-binding protein [Flavobacterium branchiophilum]|uniref:Phosphate-binding protein n=1 Tax=Flavobacterium branchiophilum TaxID=55197 RepID=A0A2H3K984_9FLAO|nr:phosphate ABC transporter substrate-binding protein [Flavobacterium branchiophilum]OXA74617.1 phosphate-binding protein [Flavobacterium branchiophilum] [Flavobacterium branchiophilum NBRC 15030 = ATCC 35035]PDS22578.1 phosphate-binding protein [Flavobacterium branchiophilum]TQM40875.1 phosphate ABC transporter substrate-binding protein (PhoT family) [Flavobacterium branchiophilum]GEM54815.1 phosphate-binding protein [Flavobacterium branchiophilum NBRC 15030 = ATCC 35035]
MKSKKNILITAFIALIALSYSFTTLNKITIKGSDTMVILSQQWAEVYMKKNPGTVIQVTGGGSGVGLAALINGSTEIANSSRPIKPAELEKIKAKFGKNAIQIPCAKDGLSVFLNKGNKVSELTIAQIGGIFAGNITNWKQVGGDDAKIQLYGRESSSGTFEFFKDHVVKTDFAPTCQTLPGTAAIINAVKKDKYSIGYGGAAYAEGVKDCKVKKDAKSKGVLPTEANIKNKTYPIARYLFMYLTAKPTGDTKKFIDWILSPEGQKIVSGVGYFPVK